MIGNNGCRTFTPISGNMDYAAQQLKRYSENALRRSQMGLEGDGAYADSFAAKLKQADEFLASGESCGATDSIGIILRQMDEAKPGQPATKEVFHNGVRVYVETDCLRGNTITIGGSANPEWIQVSTSVGIVNIDLNDTTGLMKCLDLFTPEDVTLIMKKIMEVKQAKDALREIDEVKNTPVQDAEDKEDKEESSDKSVH